MNPLTLLDKYKLILGSQSPRRKQLLAGLGLQFSVVVPDVDESFPADMPVENVAAFLAGKKSEAFADRLTSGQLLITADTIVAQQQTILNKPKDAEQAREMLLALSDKKHEVITGVYLRTTQKTDSFSVKTTVWFKKLMDEEIDFYIENYRPFDKAGAYGIQEWIGYIGIYRIDGSYFNVMGLPVQQLYTHLLKF